MQQEGSGAMEKKPFVSQSPVQFRNGVSGEKKCDFVPHRNGRSRRHGSNGGSRITDVNQSPRPASNSKWSRSYSDKRPRQRGSFENRQREEVAEAEAYDLVLSTGSRKGNANHLLNFKFAPRENEAIGRWGRGQHSQGRRGRGGHRHLPRFNKEQFLQASCQFVVREGGEYIEQAVNPDALVSWDMIEVIKRFSTEPVTCPICLQTPFAGKITKCGHIYCWACILHYLKLGDNNYRKCPICYDAVMVEDLKSVQLISVPDFSVGDEIEMKLMRKNKGCVQVMPKAEWEDREGRPMNIQDGSSTRFMKLLVASLQQIQRDVIDQERIALSAHLSDAEESEATFIRMAQTLLDEREATLRKVFKSKKKRKKAPSIPGLEPTPTSSDSSSEEEEESEQAQPVSSSIASTVEIVPVVVDSKPSKIYADAFEDEIETEIHEGFASSEAKDEIAEDPPLPRQENIAAASARSPSPTCNEFSERQPDDVENSPKPGSPPSSFPLLSDQAVSMSALSLEETAETLELPLDSPALPAQQKGPQPEKPKDAYFFYQASTGQHIYLHSLNAHCLTKEYGSLENSPETIKATIMSIERCFMTEDVRKRLRYLNHVPLTCEFYVMELKFAPPLVSKETMKFFHAEFEKKRKARLRKSKEEKMRAKRHEVDYKKSFGIYPEVQIPLSNPNQFPSHLMASASTAHKTQGQEGGLGLLGQPDNGAEGALVASPDSALEDGPQRTDQGQDAITLTPNSPDAEKSQGGAMSFAQMLKAGKSVTQPNVWGRTEARTRTTSGCSSSSSKEVGNGSDSEDLPAPSYTTSMSDAIEQALNSMEIRRQSSGDQQSATPVSGGKKKKRKEKQLLFSTAMARKN